MRNLKLLIQILVVLLIAGIGLAFIFSNDTPVGVDFVFAQIDTMSIGWWLILSFMVGAFLGLLVRVPGLMTMKLKNKKQSRDLDRKNNELMRLKGEPSKGN